MSKTTLLELNVPKGTTLVTLEFDSPFTLKGITYQGKHGLSQRLMRTIKAKFRLVKNAIGLPAQNKDGGSND